MNKKYANPLWASLTVSIMFLLYSFCIIEGPETIEDFVQMQSQEIQDNIKSRRNKIFLLMEEVSVLHISWPVFGGPYSEAHLITLFMEML